MKSICRKLLILLAICSLPTLTLAAENTANVQQAAPVQTAPQPVIQPAQPAAPVTTPVAASPAVSPITQVAADSLKPQPAILIGYVDPVKISVESDTGKAGQAQLVERKKKLQTQIEAKRKQLDKQKAAIEAKLPTFTPAQRESKSKEFQKKVEEYQKYIEKAENELQDLQQELSRTLFEKIEQAASEYGKSNNLALVTVKRDLLYLAGNVIPQDVTEAVMMLINGKGKQQK